MHPLRIPLMGDLHTPAGRHDVIGNTQAPGTDLPPPAQRLQLQATDQRRPDCLRGRREAGPGRAAAVAPRQSRGLAFARSGTEFLDDATCSNSIGRHETACGLRPPKREPTHLTSGVLPGIATSLHEAQVAEFADEEPHKGTACRRLR